MVKERIMVSLDTETMGILKNTAYQNSMSKSQLIQLLIRIMITVNNPKTN